MLDVQPISPLSDNDTADSNPRKRSKKPSSSSFDPPPPPQPVSNNGKGSSRQPDGSGPSGGAADQGRGTLPGGNARPAVEVVDNFVRRGEVSRGLRQTVKVNGIKKKEAYKITVKAKLISSYAETGELIEILEDYDVIGSSIASISQENLLSLTFPLKRKVNINMRSSECDIVQLT